MDDISKMNKTDQASYEILFAMQSDQPYIEPSVDALIKLHRDIFSIYDDTPVLRTRQAWKGCYFLSPKHIEESLSFWESDLQRACKEWLTYPELMLDDIVNLYACLNSIHPFADGNGRTQREFFRQLLFSQGHIFDLHETKHFEMVQASRAASFDNEPLFLRDIFYRTIRPCDNPAGYYSKLPYLAILSEDDIKLAITGETRRLYNG